MSDPGEALQQLLQPNSLTQSLFPPTSRYSGLALASLTRPDGATVAYVRRRFILPPESYAPLGTHTMAQGERLDLIAARFLGDPELFWRICDANAALTAEELEQEGRTLRITLPAGVTGER
jgi:hypothetical protein